MPSQKKKQDFRAEKKLAIPFIIVIVLLFIVAFSAQDIGFALIVIALPWAIAGLAWVYLLIEFFILLKRKSKYAWHILAALVILGSGIAAAGILVNRHLTKEPAPKTIGQTEASAGFTTYKPSYLPAGYTQMRAVNGLTRENSKYIIMTYTPGGTRTYKDSIQIIEYDMSVVPLATPCSVEKASDQRYSGYECLKYGDFSGVPVYKYADVHSIGEPVNNYYFDHGTVRILIDLNDVTLPSGELGKIIASIKS